MDIAFFSSQAYDREFFDRENKNHEFRLHYHDTHLGPHSLGLIEGAQAVCAFVNDKLNEEVLQGLAAKGVKTIALRCAGFNQVDLEAAKKLGFKICRVPEYSPYAVAEHAVAMILTLNRKTHKAYARVRDQNFSLSGLLGFDLHGKTVGVIGTGKIGAVFATIMLGFGCRVISYDPNENPELARRGVQPVPLDELLAQSEIISLHCPLIPKVTSHLINAQSIQKMKKGVMLINTSRGGLIDTAAAIHSLKNKHIGYLGMDVYEQEDRIFFKDLTSSIIEDDLIQRLVSFPNVLVTAHQGFFTAEALTQIAKVTLRNLDLCKQGKEIPQEFRVV